MFTRLTLLSVLGGLITFLCGCQGVVNGAGSPPPPPNTPINLSVTLAGLQGGSVTSSPGGIDCGSTCSATFTGTTVTLTASALDGSQFSGWSGACSGTGTTCTVSQGGAQSVTATFAGTLQSINHIVFMVQENRSLDHYFGALQAYRTANNYPNTFEGLPQFNNPPGPVATNPGCDPAFPFQQSPAPFNDCVTAINGAIDPAAPLVQSYKLQTQCVENPSPSWNEAHTAWNVANPLSMTATMDGFVHAAAHDIRTSQYLSPGETAPPPESDFNGIRAIGYYDQDILPYYYFMASNFATSDRWFSPVMSRTQPNREFLIAATSLGHVYPPPGAGEDTGGSTQFTNRTIFQSLQEAGISWRVYVTDSQFGSLPPHTELGMYTFANSHTDHFVPATQFLDDVKNGTLPAVSEIDPGFASGNDEHAGQDDSKPGARIQAGAHYVANIINTLMNSPSWKDTVFILTWDEAGGFFDHVQPQPTVSPDGIKPVDLKTGDVCSDPTKQGPTCDFVFTGFRVPIIVISPFSRKNFVSHTVADHTAILKLIETRFNLTNLSARDLAQMDMTEFFDFTAPWLTPPSNIPAQPTSAPCYMDHLP
jgi:phospholipase C